jgi:hypothetical protein
MSKFTVYTPTLMLGELALRNDAWRYAVQTAGSGRDIWINCAEY